MRLQHAAITGLTTGLVTTADIQHRGAIGAQLRQVALGGRVRPHFTVHGGGNQQGNTLPGARQAHQAQQLVGAPVQQLGHEVGAARSNQNGIGFSAEIDMRHVVGFAGIPLRGIDRPVTQCLHGHRGGELCCSLRHHHLHRRALFHQSPTQLCRFVASDAPSEPQYDVFSSKVVHGGQCSRAGSNGTGLRLGWQRIFWTPHSPSPSPPPGEGSLEQPIWFLRPGCGLTGVARLCGVLARRPRGILVLAGIGVRILGSDSNKPAKRPEGCPTGRAFWTLTPISGSERKSAPTPMPIA